MKGLVSVLLAALRGALFAIPAAGREAGGAVAPPIPAASAEGGRWTMPATNFANMRYSGFDSIIAANVGQPRAGFSFATGVNRAQEAAPSSRATRCMC